MRIILSPAKKMRVDTDSLAPRSLPSCLQETEGLLYWLQNLNQTELQSLWKCNDKLLALNVGRLSHMDLHRNLTPAILAYEGIAYQYMAPSVFEEGQFDYVEEHLRILSAFYGVLRPLDGVTPYRLEMGAKTGEIATELTKELPASLYEYWGSRIYDVVIDGDKDQKAGHTIINLASKEYSKCLEKFLRPEDRYITITFCEMSGEKMVTKGTYAKMARGEMVRFMAEHKIENAEEIKRFDRMGFIYREQLSSETEYVFERVRE